MTLVRALPFAAAFAFAAIAAPIAAHAQMGGMAPSSTPQADPTVAYRAGIEAINAHNFPEAIHQLQTAHRTSPNDPNINFALGLAQNANGDKQAARTSFERSARARNAPVEAHLQLGLVALDLGDRDTATTQQAALQRLLGSCDASCSDASRHAQLQDAYDQLTRALATPPAAAAAAPSPG